MSELTHGLEMETAIALAGVIFALVLGLMATLVLFLSVKREARRLVLRERRRTDRQLQELKQSWEYAYREGQASQETPMNPEFAGQGTPTVDDPALQRVSGEFREEMGLAQRAQALKQLRAGEPPDDIARQVGAPLCEIQLLARVEQHLSDLRERTDAKTTVTALGERDGEPITGPTGPTSIEDEDRSSASGFGGSPIEAPGQTATRAPQVHRAKAGGGKK